MSNFRPQGFTVIEAVIGLGLMVLIGGGVWALDRSFRGTTAFLQSSVTRQHEVNRALKLFSTDARTISPSSTGSYPIAEAAATSFTFYSDIENDGLKERLRYFVQNGVLKRGVLKPTGIPPAYNPANEQIAPLIRDVANGATPVFRYYDTSYDGTTPPLGVPVDVLDVRLANITIIVDQNGAAAPVPATFTTQVSLRNLKDNT